MRADVAEEAAAEAVDKMSQPRTEENEKLTWMPLRRTAKGSTPMLLRDLGLDTTRMGK